MESEFVEMGVGLVEIDQNHYQAGDAVLLHYRTGADVAACSAASWNDYSVPFNSLGIVQVRIESSL